MTDDAGRCTFPVPARRINARVDLDLYARGSVPKWRARCACGWDVSGWETSVDGWGAIDRHRAADQAIADLEERGNR